MSEEEQNELLKKAFANTLRKLAEEPEELFDNDKLQKKYNNLLKEHIKLKQELQQKENIIKEVREYITSYESIETMQQFDHNKNNKDLDYSTIDEMTRRYMIVHDKVLKIIDKENK